MRKSILLIASVFGLVGCGQPASPRKIPAEKPAVKVEKGVHEQPELTITPDQQKALGIQVAPLLADAGAGELQAYGVVEEDPGQRSTLSAPVAGILQSTNWPYLGQKLARGSQLGLIELRVLPVERAQVRGQRLDFSTRLLTARADIVQATSAQRQTEAEIRGARAGLENAQITLHQLEQLNSSDKNVSDRVVRDARQRLSEASARLELLQQRLLGERAKVEAARKASALLADTLPSERQLEESRPLLTPSQGEVVEVLAHPGQSVEAGTVLVRLASFRHVLARVEIPVGRRLDGLIREARLKIPGEKRSYLGTWIAASTQVAGTVHGQTFLFSLDVPDQSLRPGTPIVAQLRTGHRPLPQIPPAARLVDGEKSYVYRQVSLDRLERIEVLPEKNQPAVGDRVVVEGAQLLLSEERKASLQVLEGSAE